jgi:hypothetical protein
MRRILFILTITAIILIGTVAAEPVLPEEFYGSVYLNGNPASAGTVIVAMINGVPHGNFTTTVDGLYGGPDNFNPRLKVEANEADISAGPVNITFSVGGVQAFQIVPFQSGNSVRLDLIAKDNAFVTTTTTATSTYATSGGSSGGSVGGSYASGGSGSSSSGTGSSATTGNVMQGTTGIVTPATSSRSSIYNNIDATQTPPVVTVVTTTSASPLPSVAPVPTTKKAGNGPLSLMLMLFSATVALGVLGWTGRKGKMG